MAEKVTEQKGLYHTILGVIIDAIPNNPFAAFSNATVLQVIVFAMFMGVCALYNKETSEPMTSFWKFGRNVSGHGSRNHEVCSDWDLCSHARCDGPSQVFRQLSLSQNTLRR